MQVKCPNCQNAYKVDDHRIPDTGLKMRCPNCRTAFKVVKKKSIPPKRPTDTGDASPPKSQLSGITPKRPTRSSRPPSPALPPVPMPDPFKKKSLSSSAPIKSLDNEFDPTAMRDNTGKLELHLPDAPPRKVPVQKRKPTVTGEFDPLTESMDSLEFDQADEDLSMMSDVPDDILSVPPPMAFSNPPATTSKGLETASDEFTLDDLDPPSPSHDVRGELISLPPTDTSANSSEPLDLDDPLPFAPQAPSPPSDTSLNSSDIELDPIPPAGSTEPDSDTISLDAETEIEEYDLDDIEDVSVESARPSLALIEDNMFSRRSSTPPDPNSGDFQEIDFDSTLAKSDAFGMRTTEDLDLETDEISTPAPLSLDTSDDDFGNIGLPPASPDPGSAPKNGRVSPPPVQRGVHGSSMPPALSAFDAEEYDDDDMDSIPSPADLIDDDALDLSGPEDVLEPEAIPSPADFLDNQPPQDTLRSSAVIGGGAMDFGQVDLGGDNEEESIDLEEEGEEFDAFPTQTSPDDLQEDRQLDLADDPRAVPTSPLDMDDDTEQTDRRPEKTFEGRRKLERQRRRLKVALLLLLFGLLIGGGALSFTDYGPFGADYLFRLIPKTTDKNVVAAIVKKADSALKTDTYEALQHAISDADNGFKEYSASEDLQCLTAYLIYLSQIRFGIDEQLDNRATHVLGPLNLDESQSQYAPLTKLAQYIRYSRPIEIKGTLLKTLKQTPNGVALLVHYYLSKDNMTQALAFSRMLDKQEKSPRAGALLNQIRLRVGDDALLQAAAASLATLHKQFPKHPETTLLLADALISKKERNDNAAVALLDEVLSTEGLRPEHYAEAHALKGKLAFFKRAYKDALRNVKEAEKLAPDNMTAALYKGRIAVIQKDFTTADMSFKKVLARRPSQMIAKLGELETAIRMGEITPTQKQLEKLIKEDASNAYTHYLMGELHTAAGELDKAIKSHQTAVQLDSMLLEAYIALSKLYLRKDDHKQAMAILDQASERFKSAPLIKKTLARAHAAGGDYPSAIIELDNALKLDPDDVDAHFMMAQMYREMKSADDAQKALAEVEKRNPDYPGLALEQGRILEYSGDVAKALSSYKKALSQTPDDINLKLRVGVASHLVGDAETAQKELSAVLEANPTSPEANFYMGESHRLAHMPADAIGYLKRAAELDPQNPLYQLRYGLALIDINDMEKAMKTLETTIQLDSNQADAYVAMGKLRLQQGGPRDAIYWVEKGLEKNPKLHTGYVIIAEAYEQISKPSSAVHYYRKAVESQPENASIRFKLGLAELLVKGYAAAAGTLKKAVELAEAKTKEKPNWYPEALFRLGVAEKKRGEKKAAIATLQKYLEVAPENHIDRAEVTANLDELIH